jgi:hypothetical protein
MATLNNPVNPQNIVDRFADYVVATANAGIIWGNNFDGSSYTAKPFAEFDVAVFGGTTSGKGIGISGTNISAVGGTITASNIYNTLVAETNSYTNIRNLQAILFITGEGNTSGAAGGEIGSTTKGIVFDETKPAYLNSGYLQNIGSPNASNVVSNDIVTATGLEQFFANLRASYNTARDSKQIIQVDVCHASCHSSCHGSRGRR